MPLSEQEQRLLEEMERNLYRHDADFVATVGGQHGRRSYRALVVGILLAVLGVATLVAGVALQLLLVGIIGFILMFAGVLIAITPSKKTSEDSVPAGSQPAPPSSHGAKAQPRGSRPGFMDRMNNRWDRRQEDRD